MTYVLRLSACELVDVVNSEVYVLAVVGCKLVDIGCEVVLSCVTGRPYVESSRCLSECWTTVSCRNSVSKLSSVDKVINFKWTFPSWWILYSFQFLQQKKLVWCLAVISVGMQRAGKFPGILETFHGKFQAFWRVGNFWEFSILTYFLHFMRFFIPKSTKLNSFCTNYPRYWFCITIWSIESTTWPYYHTASVDIVCWVGYIVSRLFFVEFYWKMIGFSNVLHEGLYVN